MPEQEKKRVGNLPSQDGATPLHILAGHRKIKDKTQEGRIRAAEEIKEPQVRKLDNTAYNFAGELIKASADAQDSNGMTVFHWAARNVDERLIRELLARPSIYAGANILDNNGQLALHWAASKGHRNKNERPRGKLRCIN